MSETVQGGRQLDRQQKIGRFKGKIAPRDGWHEVGATGEPAFQNSWENYGTDYHGAAFIKDAAGVVHLRGLIRYGTISTTLPVFTLPTGFRPEKTMVFIVRSNASQGECRIEPDGDVLPYAGSNAWFSLEGISFYLGDFK